MPIYIDDKELEQALLAVGADQDIPSRSKAGIATGLLWRHVNQWKEAKSIETSSNGLDGDSTGGASIPARTDIPPSEKTGSPVSQSTPAESRQTEGGGDEEGAAA